MTEQPITIYLTPVEAEQFKFYMEHIEIFNQLNKQKAFEIGWGKVTLNFAQGTLQNIIKEEVIYKR